MGAGQPYEYVAAVLTFGERSTISAGQVRYLAATGGSDLGNELAVVIPRGGVLKNLYWSCQNSGLTAPNNRIIVYVNGSATPLRAKWDGAALSGSNTTANVSVSAGDRVSVRLRLGPTGTNIRRPRVSLELETPSTNPWLSDGPIVYYDAGEVGIGTDSPGERLSVDGIVESMTGGFKFPDGSLQASAAAGGGGGVFALQGGPAGTPPDAVTVDAGGNMAVGAVAASPQERLTLSEGSNLATEMEVPKGVAAAPASGGNLPGGSYFFRIVAEDENGETTIGSAEVSCAIDGTSEKSCSLSWAPVQGVTQYRVYIGNAAGGQDRYHESIATQYLYDGEASQDGTGPVPTVTTAYVNKLSSAGPSWVLGGNVGIGTTQPGATLQINGDLLLARGVPISEISDDSTLADNRADAVPTQHAVKEYVDGLLVGSVTAFAMATPPRGWLECNGQAISRTTYARLFGRIGTTYNGTNTPAAEFNVPDLRGEFLRGWDNGREKDQGRVFGSVQDDQFQDHHHETRDVVQHTYGKHGAPVGGTGGLGLTWKGVGATQEAVTTNPFSGAHGGETRPTNYAMLFCIKY